eukprot:13122469-Alexandrium_andersonii.AAC.1
MAFLVALPTHVIGELALLIPVSCQELHSQILLAASCGVAFLHYRVFRVLSGFPWSLAQGDPMQ